MPAVLDVRRWSTPQLFRLTLAVLVVLGAIAGITAVATVRHRSAMLTEVTAAQGPLSVEAQELYRRLSDADATAANAFLAEGSESSELRRRYLDDIARASAALAVALRAADDSDAARLAVLADQLPVYTGLVETARSYDRLGLPLGGAYFREASALMRQTLLPAAQDLHDAAQQRVAAAQREAGGTPAGLILTGLIFLAAVITAQVMLTRRTNRLFNIGLVSAALLIAGALTWSVVALGAASRHAEIGSRHGTERVTVLADARRAALQARADEALTLIARGSGATFEREFGELAVHLTGPDGNSGVLGRAVALSPEEADRVAASTARTEVQRWFGLHAEVRKQDDGGAYDKAVALATADGPETLSGAYEQVDKAFTDALSIANERVEDRAERAAGALRFLTAALILLTVAQLAAVVLGFRPRIGEYR